MAEEGEAQPTEEQAAPAEPEQESLLGEVESTGEAEAAAKGEAEEPVEPSNRDPHKNDPDIEPVEQPSEQEETTYEEGERPEWLPEKFNSPEELVKAYNEMGNTIRGKFDLPEGFTSPEEVVEAYNNIKENGPEPPETYDLQAPEGLGDPTDADVEMFKEAGLTNQQAQKVMDQFAENVLPSVHEKQAEVENERLGRQWQMEPNTREFQDRMSQIKSWAEENMPAHAVNEMAKTSNGVNALYQMMQSGMESRMVSGSSAGTARLTQDELNSMVQDERYWTDPAYRQDVERKLGLGG